MMMMEIDGKLDPNHLLFVNAWFRLNQNALEAYKEVYACDDASAIANAYRLLKRDDIKAEIARRQAVINREAHVDVSYVIARSLEIVERCMQHEAVKDREGNETGVYKFDASGANKSLDRLARYLGMDNRTLKVEDNRGLDEDAKRRIERVLSGSNVN